MKYFNQEEFVENLPGIIILSHGPMAVGAVGSLKMISGDTVNVAAFSLEDGQSPEEYIGEFSEAIELYPEDSIIFVDIMGGTPSNSIIMYARKNNKMLNCIAGFNLSMLLETVGAREFMRGQELFDSIVNLDNHGTFNISDFLKSHVK